MLLRDTLEEGGYFKELSKGNLLEALKKQIADFNSKIVSMDGKLREVRAKNGVYREICLESSERLEDVINLVEKRLSIFESAQSKCASAFDNCVVNIALENPYAEHTPVKDALTNVERFGKSTDLEKA